MPDYKTIRLIRKRQRQKRKRMTKLCHMAGRKRHRMQNETESPRHVGSSALVRAQRRKNKMKPHQERVVTEKNELDDKRQKLTAFIGGEVYRTLDAVEQSRLNRQLEAMTLYANILGERIEAFV